MRSYLAIDIGASSGRHMLLTYEGGEMRLSEVYRFPNQMEKRDGHDCWDADALFAEVVEGIRQAFLSGADPVSIGIDTWGVDYVLLGAEGERLGEAYAYRDGRTQGMDEALEKTLSPEALYARTGLQKQPFNGIYQLMADQAYRPETLARAQHLLQTPSYLTYRLTGRMMTEYTEASTTALLDTRSRDWDWELIDKLGLPRRPFGQVYMSGTEVGPLLPKIAEQVGGQTQVRLTTSHDTAGAVLAAPLDESSIFLSSGTWSLLGLEQPQADTSARALAYDVSNEGGYGNTYLWLKNIMGMWITQELRKEQAPGVPYGELEAMARSADAFATRIDVNDALFYAPESMTEALNAYCRRTNQPEPVTLAEALACTYHSLADNYAEAIAALEALAGRTYRRLCIIGGGSQNTYLNQLTADRCDKAVIAGPVEATAIGNVVAQMLADGTLGSVEEARQCIMRSFATSEYLPAGWK